MDFLANDTLVLLKEKATTDEYRKASVLTVAVRKALAALTEKSSVANHKNYKESEKVHTEYVGGLAKKYLLAAVSNTESGTEDDTFANRLEAWQYLQDSGWQIGRSQFYEHCKQGRLPRKDGRYLRADVDRYAGTHCRLVETGEKVNDKLSRMAEEKAETELNREKTRLEKEKIELAIKRGDHVARDEVEQMIVGRAVAMLSHLRAMVRMKASDWIALVDGDQKRQRELIDALNEGLEEHLAVFAKDVEFEVIFEKNVEGERL